MSDQEKTKVGSVMQIIDMPESHKGWIGAFLLVSEVKAFGVQGFVHTIIDHDNYSQAYTRLNWEQVHWIGQSVMIPSSLEERAE